MSARRGALALAAVAVAASLAVLAPVSAAIAATEIPPAPTVEHPVVDQTGTLSASDIAAINAAAAAGHAKNGQQTGVLIIETTGGEDIADYSIKVARSWGIGEKDADNGVLIVIALSDHKLRIEVGKGLEGDLTDQQTGRIISDQMVPLIKNGDVPGAVLAGVKAVQVGVSKPAAADESSGDIAGAFVTLAIWAGIMATIVILAMIVGHLFSVASSGKRTSSDYTDDGADDSAALGSKSRPSGMNRSNTARRHGSSSDAGSSFLGGFAGGYLGSSLGSSSSSSDSGSSYSGGGFDSGSTDFGGGSFDGGGASGGW